MKLNIDQSTRSSHAFDRTTQRLVKNPLPALTRQPIFLVVQPVVLVGQVQAVFAVRAGQPASCCLFLLFGLLFLVLHQTNQTATTQNTNRVPVALVLWCSFFFKSCSLDFSFFVHEDCLVLLVLKSCYLVLKSCSLDVSFLLVLRRRHTSRARSRILL